MAKGFKFPAPKGFAKGGMCSPKGAKAYAKGGYAKGGPARGTNIEASDLYEDSNDMASVEAGRNVPRENKNRMRSESTQMARTKNESETGGYAKGGKVKKYANGGVATGPSRTSPPPRPAIPPVTAVSPTPPRPTTGDPGPRSVPTSVSGTAIPPAPPRPVTGSPKPRQPIAPVVAPLSAAAQGRSTGLPPPKPVPGPVTGTALSPAQQGRSTGLPMARPVPAPVTGTAIAGAGKFANGGKVTMKKMKGGRKFLKTGYADGGEVETEQMASKSTRVKMPRSGKTQMSRAKSVPVDNRQPMIQPKGPSMMGASPLARVANTAPSMGMKMGGKAKKH